MITDNTSDVNQNAFSTPVKNASSFSIKYLLLFLFIFFIFNIVTSFNAHAEQNVSIEFCVKVTHKHGGSDSKQVHVSLTGVGGKSSGNLKLDNPGMNDFRKGQLSCFFFNPIDMNAGKQDDIGFHQYAIIEMKSSIDDFCVSEVFSKRFKNFDMNTNRGILLSTSKFSVPREVCVGSHDNGSKTLRRFKANNAPAKVKVTASRPVAKWVQICNKTCNIEIEETVTVGESTEKVNSSSETEALSVSIGFGVEFPGGSASAEATSSFESTSTQQFSRAISSESSTAKKRTVAFTAEELGKFNIDSVWQWVAESTLSNGKKVLIRSLNTTCRPDSNPPTYMPGSPEDEGSCRREEMSEIEKAKLEQIKLQTAILRKQLEPQQQPKQERQEQQEQELQEQELQEQELQQYNSADLEVTPALSPIRIWMPSSWVKNTFLNYDLTYSDPSENAFVAFKFMNKDSTQAEVSEVFAGVSGLVAEMKESEPTEKIQINGMPTDIYRYTGKMSGNAVEVFIMYVDPPETTQGVFALSIVGASEAAEFEVTLSDILEGIEPN
jgi:hypothetical protein